MAQQIIRQGEEADLAALLGLDYGSAMEPAQRELIGEALLDKRCWVLEVEEAIVGYGLLSHTFYGRTFLDLIYIDASQRSNGYGPQLILFLEQHSRSSDFFTSTNQSNAHMQHVLEKLGYVKSGMIDNLDPGDPEIVYIKKSVRS